MIDPSMCVQGNVILMAPLFRGISGILLGSVLESMLFGLFLNNLPNNVCSPCNLYTKSKTNANFRLILAR